MVTMKDVLKRVHLKNLKEGMRVRYTGVSSYSYPSNGWQHSHSNSKGTVVAINPANVVILLDDTRKPYLTKWALAKSDEEPNLWVFPAKDYATVGMGDLVTGNSVIKIDD